jgi:serine phosphatase RsbU (regulator of sigma subunit)
MKNFKTIWNLFENSDDQVFIFENDSLIKWNLAADKIIKGLGLKTDQFSLACMSPGLQPCGKYSADKEKEIKKVTVNKSFYRFEWVINRTENEESFVEVTLYHSKNNLRSYLLMILRDINQHKQCLQILEWQKNEIAGKNEEIELHKNEIVSQKEKIEIQRDLAERQRDEILTQKQALTDSIRYASRIQSALLPEKEFLENSFSDYFILNKPRDIVSGDFYWVSKKNNKAIVAVADCTGHGVPGAFMSMLGMAFLDEIVNDAGIIRPDNILDTLRDRIIKTLGQTGRAGETSDGMDIALVSVDLADFSLQFSGAYNPAFIIRDKDLMVIKGDKMPLGFQMSGSKSFTNQELQLKPGDSIYLFSDGYSDQFGWRNDKKFTLNNFRELLLSIQNVPMKAQKVLLENNLKNWMGDLDQVDDIMILGIQI